MPKHLPETVQRTLDRLSNVRPTGKGWTALCPAHGDRQNSLSISVGDDGRVLLNCFAGCPVEDIGRAIDLEMKDLFPDRRGRGTDYPDKSRATTQHPRGNPQKSSAADRCTRSDASNKDDATTQATGCTLAQYAKAKALPESFLRDVGLADMTYMGDRAVRIPYFDRDGEIQAVRFRISVESKGKFRWRRGDKLSLYGLNRLDADPSYILICEGESDCHTLWYHGEPALGLPGAGNWNEDRDASFFDDVAVVYVIHEGDKGGEAIEDWLSKSQIRDRARLVSLDKWGVKDPSALHIQDPGQFKARWQEAQRKAVPWVDQAARAVAEERDAAWQACADLAKANDILVVFILEFGRLAVGEERTAKLLFLALVSRLLDQPVSVAVKGPSSGGKSYVVEVVLHFFPKTAYYAVTAMSEKALAYGDEPLQHRFIVVFEAAGMEGDMQSYLIRSLLSEGRLVYDLVEKTKDGLRPRRIEREGPTGLIVTTTAIRLHPENETRLLSVLVTDTQEQTRAVFEALADEDTKEPHYEPWHALQTWVASGPREVTIPFAKVLARLATPSATRLRRDFRAVLTLIRAHALLHQVNRKQDDNGRIVATLDDYAAVREIVADIVAQAVEATVPSIVRETVNAVQRRVTDGQGHVSLAELAADLKLDKATVSRRVRAAKVGGYLRDLETKRGRPSKLIVGDPMPEDQPVLPSVEDLALQCCSDDGGVKASPSHELCASEVALDDADLEERLAIQNEPPLDDLTEIPPQFDRSSQRNG